MCEGLSQGLVAGCRHSLEAGHQRLLVEAREAYVSPGSADTSLILWDLERLECLRTFEGHDAIRHLRVRQATRARCARSPPASPASGRSVAQMMAPCGFGALAVALMGGHVRSFNQRSALQTLRCPHGTPWAVSASAEHQSAATWAYAGLPASFAIGHIHMIHILSYYCNI